MFAMLALVRFHDSSYEVKPLHAACVELRKTCSERKELHYFHGREIHAKRVDILVLL